MGLDPFSLLAIGSTLLAATSSFVQAGQAQAQAAAAEAAARENNELQQEELSRQQRDVREVEQQAKSDRVRQAERDLGALRVAEGEAGLTSTAFLGFVNEVAASEGIDIARIDANADERAAALQAQKRAVAQGATNTIIQARNEARSTTQRAIFEGIGSGLQIGFRAIDRQDRLAAQKNKRRI